MCILGWGRGLSLYFLIENDQIFWVIHRLSMFISIVNLRRTGNQTVFIGTIISKLRIAGFDKSMTNPPWTSIGALHGGPDGVCQILEM